MVEAVKRRIFIGLDIGRTLVFLASFAAFIICSSWLLKNTKIPHPKMAGSQSTENQQTNAAGTSISAWLSTFIPAFAIFAIQLIVFNILRKKIKRVYEPKTVVQTTPFKGIYNSVLFSFYYIFWVTNPSRLGIIEITHSLSSFQIYIKN